MKFIINVSLIPFLFFSSSIAITAQLPPPELEFEIVVNEDGSSSKNMFFHTMLNAYLTKYGHLQSHTAHIQSQIVGYFGKVLRK